MDANVMEGDVELSIVVVNHNSWDDVTRLVAEVGAAPEVATGRCELIVVDNDSQQRMPEGLRTWPRGVSLIARADNGGFAAGVNTGWRQSRGRWVLLLNPDVVVEPGFVTRILERVAHHESRTDAPGIVGFALRNPDGTKQPSVGAWPGVGRTFVEAFLPRSRRKYKAVWRVRPGRVPWVTGACMLVDARLLSALGGMDEDFFLYYEEVALCRAAWRRGRSVEYDPALSVVHLRPLQNRRVSPRMRIVTRHSRLLFFQKQGSKAQFWAILWLTRVEAVVRGAWAGVLGRTDARRAWRGVAQIVRDFSAARPPRGAAVRQFADAIMANPPVTTHLDRRIDARGSAPPSPALPATARPQSNGSDDSPTIAPRPICLDGSHGREHGS